MKGQAVKTKAAHTATVSRSHPAGPFFRKNTADADHAAQSGPEALSRPWFEKTPDRAAMAVDTPAEAAVVDQTSASHKTAEAGRAAEVIPLFAPPTVESETLEASPEVMPAPVAPAPPQAEFPDSGETPKAGEGPEKAPVSEAAPAGPAPSPPPPTSPPAPSAAATAPAPAAATPTETGQQFSALPPSVQADTYAGLGTALVASVANEAAATQDAVPDRQASLEGETEPPATPVIATPAAAPSAAGQILTAAPEPVLAIPEAPAPAPVDQPDVPTAPPAEAGSMGKTLEAIDPAPAIETTLVPPEIPLEGKADPAALDHLETAAAGEADQVLGTARSGVAAVPPEVVQPQALDETIPTPKLPEIAAQTEPPRVEGMDKLSAYALGPLDRAAFDQQAGPSMQAAVAGAQAELAQQEQDFDQERTALHLAADNETIAARTDAQVNQRLAVEQGRQALAAEQQQTLDQQQAAVDNALGELSASREEKGQAIDERLAADRASVDEVYAAAESEARTEVEKGTARADETERDAAEQAESESWWDWAIDTWQAVVQAVADKVVAIWEAVAAVVAGILDRALALAAKVVNAAVAFVKKILSAYFDLWLWLIENLVAEIFPELAAALAEAIENVKAAVFAALDDLAAAYLQMLRFIADQLIAGLYAALEVYKAGVAAYLALWEAIQNGEWADIGRTLLSAMLTAVGIDPEEFFATFGKIDEVIDEIVADPTLIGRRAIDALSLGFYQFGTNFIGNFITAFVEWITGAARIVLPKTFSIAGIFDVVCQILNLTYDYLREKAVQHVGEGAVTAVEELFEAIKTFIAEGWSGLWNLVKDKLTTLVDDVVIAMGTWLVEKAILVAGRWIAGLIATMGWSAIIEGLIALWQFIMWVKDQFQQFWQIVKSTVDSVHEFVKGLIQPAADTIEGTLQDLIVPAIDLVAKLLNLGNIAKKVEQIIESIRQMVDKAIDSLVASLKKALGLGKKGKKSEAENEGDEEGDDKEKESRHGKITLAMLNEPPVPASPKRTKMEEEDDLDVAAKVLKLAEEKAEDTADITQYFGPIKTRFRLKSIDFDSVSGGKLGVRMHINPAITPTIHKSINARAPRAGEGYKLDPPVVTDIKHSSENVSFSGSSQNFHVGIIMEATPLGPDHPAGSRPSTSAQSSLFGFLPTRSQTKDPKQRYVKGHLLNDNMGGEGKAHNLFPMIETANNPLFSNSIEKWVKDQVKEHFFVYYRVEIEPEGSDLSQPDPIDNYVNSTIKAEAGYWITSSSGYKKPPDSQQQKFTIQSIKPQSGADQGASITEKQEKADLAKGSAVSDIGFTSLAVSSDAIKVAERAVEMAEEAVKLAEKAEASYTHMEQLPSLIDVQDAIGPAQVHAEAAKTSAEEARRAANLALAATSQQETEMNSRLAEDHANKAKQDATNAVKEIAKADYSIQNMLHSELAFLQYDFEKRVNAGFLDLTMQFRRFFVTSENLRSKWFSPQVQGWLHADRIDPGTVSNYSKYHNTLSSPLKTNFNEEKLELRRQKTTERTLAVIRSTSIALNELWQLPTKDESTQVKRISDAANAWTEVEMVRDTEIYKLEDLERYFSASIVRMDQLEQSIRASLNRIQNMKPGEG